MLASLLSDDIMEAATIGSVVLFGEVEVRTLMKYLPFIFLLLIP